MRLIVLSIKLQDIILYNTFLFILKINTQTALQKLHPTIYFILNYLRRRRAQTFEF